MQVTAVNTLGRLQDTVLPLASPSSTGADVSPWPSVRVPPDTCTNIDIPYCTCQYAATQTNVTAATSGVPGPAHSQRALSFASHPKEGESWEQLKPHQLWSGWPL